MLAYLGHHGIRQRPLIEGIRPLCGQSAQHLGQRRVGQPGACRFGAAIRLIEVGTRLRIPCQIGILGQQCGQPWTYYKSLFCQRDGGLEQRSPGQLAITLMGQSQGAQGTGNADRTAPDHPVIKRQRLAILHKQLVGGGSRRRLAAIHRTHLVAIPHQQQRSATDPGGLRLHQRQYQLHRNGGIDGTATGLDDLVARIHRQRVGGRHHEVMALPALFVGPATGRLRRDQGLGWRGVVKAVVTSTTGQQGKGDSEPQRFAQHDTLLVCFMTMKRDYVTIGADSSSY